MKETLILGYAPHLKGGVTGVSRTLAGRLVNARIFPVLGMYGRPVGSVFYTGKALFAFLCNLLVRRVGQAIVVVGSPGDAVRTLPFIVACRLTRVPFFIHFHKDLTTIFSGRPLLRVVAMRLWKRADSLVFLSDGLAREGVADFGLDHRLCRVIPNGLEPAWLGMDRNPRDRRCIDIVFVGRWHVEKGSHDLEVLFGPERLGNRFACHAFGSRPGHSLRANIVFHGWCDSDELAKVLRQANLLILPSYAEAYPTVLLEAAAAGTPFVSTSIAGIPDIVTNSGGGRTAEPGDVSGLAAAVEGLLSDPDAWEAASQSAYAWAQKQGADRYAAEWQKILDQSASASAEAESGSKEGHDG